MSGICRRISIRLAMLLVLSSAVFLSFVGSRDIATSHEARVVQVARRMADAGWPWDAKRVQVPEVALMQTPQGLRLNAKPDGSTLSVNPWLVPVLSGQIRLQKPPLPYWCSAAMFRLFGVGEGTARSIPALLGAIAVLIVWDLARLLIGRVGAWYAAMVWVSTFFSVDEFRKAMADPYLAFFTLMATWTWVRATTSGVGLRHRGWPTAVWLLLFYASLAMGMLAKGPLIVLFVAVYLVLFHVLYRRRLPGSIAAHGLGVGVFIVLGLGWFYIVWRTLPNAMELWRYESIGELSDNVEKARGWWFYLPNLLQIGLPWTPVWLLGIGYTVWAARRADPRTRRIRYRRVLGVMATVLVVLIFSLSNVKKNAYLLPLMPIEAVVAGQGLLALTVMFRRDPKSRPVGVSLRRAAVFAVVFAIGIQVMESAVLARSADNRSPKEACRLVVGMVGESPGTSVLVSRLAEEATVYLPVDWRDATTSDRVLVILDDRKGTAEATAHAITSTPSGPVVAVEEIPVPASRGERWRIFALRIDKTATAPTTPGAD